MGTYELYLLRREISKDLTMAFTWRQTKEGNSLRYPAWHNFRMALEKKVWETPPVPDKLRRSYECAAKFGGSLLIVQRIIHNMEKWLAADPSARSRYTLYFLGRLNEIARKIKAYRNHKAAKLGK